MTDSKCSQDDLSNSIQTTFENNFKLMAGKTITSKTTTDGETSTGMDAVYNNLINQLTCDSECQKRKKLDALKQSWLDAKTTEQNAPANTFETHKEYLIAEEGQLGYDTTMMQRYSKIAMNAKNKAIQEHNTTNEELQTLIKDYDAERISLNKIREMLNIRLRENKQLQHAVDQDIAAVETNGRRVAYGDWAKDDIQSLYTLLIWIYIILIFVYIYTSGFITNSGWKNKRAWFVIFGMFIFPFIIYRFAIGLIYIYERFVWYMDNKVPKDVYLQQADNVEQAKIY